MPQPSLIDVHVNQPLTNVSIAYLQSLNDFVHDKVFPMVPVNHRSDVYYKYLRDNWNRSEAKKRAPATESAGSGYELTTDSYKCDVYAIHKDVDDQIRANQDGVIDMDREATEFVTRQLMLQRELSWASNYFTTGVWTGSTTGTDVVPGIKWDAAGSTPIEDIRAQLISTKEKTGFRANTVVMGEEVWSVLQDHPDFLDRIKYTQTGIVTEDLFASVLQVDKVLVAGGIQNIATEGQTEDNNFIYGDSMLLAYSAPSPGLMTPSAGYTFTWRGFVGNNEGMRIKRFRMDPLSADRVEGECAYDQKVVDSVLGAFLTDVLT